MNIRRKILDAITPAPGCILTTGCFDLITRGHLELLNAAADLYKPCELYVSMLYVGINDDESVRKLKGPTRPINNEEDRMFHLAALQMVDRVFLIRSINVANAIRKLKPTIWVKGGDYTMETLNQEEVAAAKEVGARIVLFPKFGAYSSTSVIEKLQQP